MQEQFTGPTALPVLFQRTLGLLSQQAFGTDDLFFKESDTRKVSLLRQAWDRGQDPLRLAGVSDCYAVSPAAACASIAATRRFFREAQAVEVVGYCPLVLPCYHPSCAGLGFFFRAVYLPACAS